MLGHVNIHSDIHLTTVSAYWWKGRPNWGDALTPLILRQYAHLDATYAPPDRAEVVCIGSVLGNLILPSYLGTIIGSGKLHEGQVVPPRARILALRGPLTAQGVPGNYALGDPGLLVDGLVKLETKQHNLGLVPHWSDTRPFTDTPLAENPEFTKYNPVVIDPFGDPLDVVRMIGSCNKIVSSSLHGLIVADSFSIPRRFEPTGKWANEGGDFKLRDYNASIGMTDFKVSTTQQTNWNRVIDIKCGLYDAFNTYLAIVTRQSP